MVIINVAYTAPVNPAGASPVLSQSSLWEGLRRKVRSAQEFVPMIKSCDVLWEGRTEAESGSNNDNERVIRQVTFAPGEGPKAKTGGPVKEVCVHYPPYRIVFEQEDGSTISNIISKGPAGELYMTYVFEWRHPDVPAGSPEAAALEEAHWKVSHGEMKHGGPLLTYAAQSLIFPRREWFSLLFFWIGSMHNIYPLPANIWTYRRRSWR